MEPTEKLKISYRGFDIIYRSFSGHGLGGEGYSIEGDERKEYPSITKVKESIDRMMEKKFKQIPVIVVTGYGQDIITEGTATSITDDDEVWVTYKNAKSFSKRSKYSSGVYHDTPENRKVVEEIKQLNKLHETVEQEYEEERKRLFTSMTSLTKK